MSYDLQLKTYNRKGYSIIEVMLSIAIITVAFVTIINVFPFSLITGKKAQNLTAAAYLAQAGIEQTINASYEEITVGAIEAKARLSEDVDNFLYNFSREIIVNYVDENLADSVSDEGLKKITVTVYWDKIFSAGEEEYEVATLVSER